MIKLREYRKRSGLTMKKLGEMVGASEASISQYETGRVEPDIELMIKMSNVLGITVDNLIGRTEETETEKPITDEARILVKGIDRLPPEDRKQILDMARLMFKNAFDNEVSDETGL